MSIRATHAVLVILDISGYTRFIHQRVVSLEHAEAIISELLEAVIDEASHPLLVNKLEGDAALLYAETGEPRADAVNSVYRQLTRFFAAFKARASRIREDRQHCACDACANISTLRLKAILHVGDIVVKQVRQFEEIAGDPVILLHRLLKNDIPSHEYLLLTDAARALLPDLALPLTALQQSVDGLAPSLVHWCETAHLPLLLEPVSPNTPPPPSAPRDPDAIVRVARFHHLPSTLFDRLQRWWKTPRR